MKRKHVLTMVILTFVALVLSAGELGNKVLLASPNGEQKSKTSDPTPEPTPWPGAVVEDSIAQLKALFLPTGIDVVESKMIKVHDVRTYRTVTVEWKAYKDAPLLVDYDSKDFAHIKELKLIESSSHEGTLQSQRLASVSKDEIVVAGIDENAKLLWWTRMPDPRLLRSEGADSSGRIQAGFFHRSKVEVLVNVPESDEISELRFYLPQWTGMQFILDPLYAVSFKEKKDKKWRRRASQATLVQRQPS